MIYFVIRSETFRLDDHIDLINDILRDAIRSFVSKDEEIINIEQVEKNGLRRFYIYVRRT